ncbi:hypothetical protein DL95DRAFT_367777 [Leptodontidium sp. 2 PMI_412]|nr:hypothetical protein DL95DRAFT_367777 [Leptodontidium sp. 2 PMI_412]
MAPILRVGILGAGEVAQVVHLPVLQMLSHLYTVQSICDISKENTDHCAAKFRIPQGTTNPDDLFDNPAVDVVFVLTSDEFHETYTVAALRAGKHVMLEKPASLSIPSVRRIIEAERASGGKRVFVGYMRRYAGSFLEAFKRELATIPRITYARVRDIIGPHTKFVAESGTEPVRSSGFPEGAEQRRNEALDRLYAEAFPKGVIKVTEQKKKLCRWLGGLGSHDVSLMREAFGMPDSVAGVSVTDGFWCAIFNYRNTGPGFGSFAVTYESGFDQVPNFDAHLAVYGERKRVLIKYDSPYIKGLPTYVEVDEVTDTGEVQSRRIVSSFEDAYTSEMKDMYECLVNGRFIKTSAEDALSDLLIFDMMYKRMKEP